MPAKAFQATFLVLIRLYCLLNLVLVRVHFLLDTLYHLFLRRYLCVCCLAALIHFLKSRFRIVKLLLVLCQRCRGLCPVHC